MEEQVPRRETADSRLAGASYTNRGCPEGPSCVTVHFPSLKSLHKFRASTLVILAYIYTATSCYGYL